MHFDLGTHIAATSTYLFLVQTTDATTRYVFGGQENTIPESNCFTYNSGSGVSTACTNVTDMYVVLYGYYANTVTPEAVLGSLAVGREPHGNFAVPTSTYVETPTSAGSQIMDIGWGSVTGTVTSTGTYARHLDDFFDVATSTFPMCFVYPWFALIDLLEGQTLVNQTAQSITISGGMVPTTTFSLQSFPTTAAAIGLRPVIDTILAFLIPILWLAFGLFVFVDLFAPKTDSSTE